MVGGRKPGRWRCRVAAGLLVTGLGAVGGLSGCGAGGGGALQLVFKPSAQLVTVHIGMRIAVREPSGDPVASLTDRRSTHLLASTDVCASALAFRAREYTPASERRDVCADVRPPGLESDLPLVVCGRVYSTDTRVLVRVTPVPKRCDTGEVVFRAVAAGQADLRGALPCRVPECAAAAAVIRVRVTRA